MKSIFTLVFSDKIIYFEKESVNEIDTDIGIEKISI